ncbi:DUF262 domain-containing protein [Eubacteriales bacterium OttesenSCG-928-A19]|nr:DUF262 domain-containing protein [Eubacteriales bacterium OttesenSCG-928-A19]
MPRKAGEKKITQQQKTKAEAQLKELQRSVDYDTKDFTVEHLIAKFLKGDFFVPDYQRKFVWADTDRASFIESVLLGLPIPFMFLGDCEEDGKMEIIDGVQRINTLTSFSKNELELRGLPKLTELNGFRFNDLSEAQQRRFNNRTLRIIVLDENTPNELRQDIFSRVNRSGKRVNDSEFRRGAYPGRLTNFIDQCANDPLFVTLCPVTDNQKKRHERFELLLRFFAYVNDYESFEHKVSAFLDSFLTTNQNTFSEEEYTNEFRKMCVFVERTFPNGFAKTESATTTPRVRFEAIAVGSALALRVHPDLVVHDISWLNSKKFEEYTTSDASNNQGKLKRRVEYVRDCLLEGAKHE